MQLLDRWRPPSSDVCGDGDLVLATVSLSEGRSVAACKAFLRDGALLFYRLPVPGISDGHYLHPSEVLSVIHYPDPDFR